ncbi:hypothetical protein H257_16985 [Aphanomyces astaci]|uniref:Longin domain-containing protein n=1 Tax=Aphanomyces astaci TaxID=112090 RepID=W4FGB4_APHAT|nr:hypothetical protein H257_16985 [Aphanomyces astaci]ETV66542.1 hypothetical protein H257_16985 [Aphanomyces astaci]|eukprot:XP_009843913.1 hypothetical protein H257_16985 [Aphanomyces astaci]
MPILTFIARVSDGMLLVASMESAGDYNDNLDTYKQQGKQILKKLNQRSPGKCSIDSGAYAFHYLIEEGVCYLTLSDKNYPKRLAFLYLEDIHGGFIDELRRDHGDNWRDTVTTVARPYAFIKFDKYIQKKRKEYTDPSSSQNMSKLNNDLADIHNVMRQNIQEVLNRGEAIDRTPSSIFVLITLLKSVVGVSQISSNIADRSKEFKWGAKKLSLQAMYQKYGPLVAIALFVVLVVYFKFF